ncbi:MAG: GTP cyclohydrolase I [Candidatus Aramenus sulfurataquae]|jgi:GTP cyclohydrolase I|uniref:GTP cyclohydrolase 1 n=2 Tax=Candidatus Aramenus sulfurataquae TaxID=1326980 RepID=W7KNY2_9CREN|nr:MAG: GTP cyclohydrolase I [Candidatus Aramenus sulfurataquae]MCL7343524.1 GTP cyclohydrolase I [Candidatus Aramenus sulfurataquae]
METSINEEKLVEEISKRIREILELLGEDPNREGIRETPVRVAKALLDMTYGLRSPQPSIKVFKLRDEEGLNYDDEQLILAKDIQFSSLCEHHLLPFIGKIHIAYVVGEEARVAGFSKLIRIVNYYASRPQIQERLVNQIADAIMNSEIKPKGVIVIGNAIHMCVYVRGVKDKEAKLLSIATRGVFKKNRALTNRVLRLLETSERSSSLI